MKQTEATSDVTTLREALAAALRHARNPEDWIFPGYRAGLLAYDNWIQAAEAGTSSKMGMSYNAAVWEECRRQAVAFLLEARDRVGAGIKGLFDEAIGHYRGVSTHLRAVVDLFPFSQEAGLVPVDENARKAVSALRSAREAEAAGLAALSAILDGLEGTDS